MVLVRGSVGHYLMLENVPRNVFKVLPLRKEEKIKRTFFFPSFCFNDYFT